MRDRLGRMIDYVRISVTDRCNLRCVYCMPENGVQLQRKEEILTFDEIVRVCRLFASMGIRFIRLTGGEPLIRYQITDLIQQIKAVDGIEKVTLTTNGVLLADMADALIESGIDGINVSLDSMDREQFQAITRYDMLSRVLQGIDLMSEKEIPIKINCVTICQGKGHERAEDEERLIKVAELAKDRAIDVRMIELMPIGYGVNYQFIEEDRIRQLLQERYGMLQPFEEICGNGPGTYYTIDGFVGRIGFISAISHKFCNSCNRIRLTSQGFLKSCLQYDIGTDLRGLLRNGGTDQEIEMAIHQSIMMKPEGHRFWQTAVDQTEHACMSQIGG